MERKKKNQIIIELCCFIAAFALWLYISYTDNSIITQTVKNVKVDIINMDSIEERKLVELPKDGYTVNIKVTGLASDVRAVANKPEAFKLVADISKYSLKKGENKIPVVPQIEPSNVKVLNTTDMWVVVNLDDLVEKTVPVKAEKSGKPKEGYTAFDPTVKLSEVTIKGAAKYVNKVAYGLVKAKIDGLTSDANRILQISLVDSSGNVVDGVKAEKEYTDVTIPIKKIKTVGINIVTKGIINKDISLRAYSSEPDKIDIAGTDEAVAKINSLNTEPIDLSKISLTTIQNGFMEVKLVYPDNIKLADSNGTVRIKLEGGKIGQKYIPIDVQYKNIKDGYTVKPEKTNITLVVSGEEAILKNLKNEDFSAYIDFAAAVEGENVEMPIVLGNLPQGVTKVSVSAEKVKVTIAKKS